MHTEHAQRMGIATRCTAAHVNFGGGCLNCGWEPPRGGSRAMRTAKPCKTCGLPRASFLKWYGCPVCRVIVPYNSSACGRGDGMTLSIRRAAWKETARRGDWKGSGDMPLCPGKEA